MTDEPSFIKKLFLALTKLVKSESFVICFENEQKFVVLKGKISDAHAIGLLSSGEAIYRANLIRNGSVPKKAGGGG